MEDILVKDNIFTLSVYQGLNAQDIASEIDPIQVGEFRDNDEYWDNGPTRYHRWNYHTIWLIRWNNKFHLIEYVTQEGSYADDGTTYWKTIDSLPETLQIINA
jgi:hypothetical protein